MQNQKSLILIYTIMRDQPPNLRWIETFKSKEGFVFLLYAWSLNIRVVDSNAKTADTVQLHNFQSSAHTPQIIRVFSRTMWYAVTKWMTYHLSLGSHNTYNFLHITHYTISVCICSCCFDLMLGVYYHLICCPKFVCVGIKLQFRPTSKNR